MTKDETAGDGTAYCRYHDVEHNAPLCDCHNEPKNLLGYDGGPHGWGHIWVCSVEDNT